MDDKLFRKILYGLLIAGVISVIVMVIITIFLYNQASIITFIEKELW